MTSGRPRLTRPCRSGVDSAPVLLTVRDRRQLGTLRDSKGILARALGLVQGQVRALHQCDRVPTVRRVEANACAGGDADGVPSISYGCDTPSITFAAIVAASSLNVASHLTLREPRQLSPS